MLYTSAMFLHHPIDHLSQSMFNPRRKQAVLLSALSIILLAQAGFCAQSLEREIPESDSSQSQKKISQFAGRYVHIWADSTVPVKANILCIHGLGLSAADYDAFARYIAKFGIRTYALNIDGFGPAQERSETARLNFETTIEGIERTLDQIKKEHPQEPLFLLGESLGGTIVLDLAARFPNKIDGLICSAPTWHYYGEKSVRLRALLSLIFGHWARRILVTKSIVTRATSDQKLQRHWLLHPDHRLDLSISEACNVVSYVRKTPSRAKRIDHTPALIMQGLNDRLCKPNAVAKLFSFLPSRNRTVVLDCGQEHVIFEEGRFSKASVEALLDWVDAQTQAKDIAKPSHPRGMQISSEEISKKQNALIKKFFKTAKLHDREIELRNKHR